MKIDPKYFNRFLGIVAAVAVLLITTFIIMNRSQGEAQFQERMFGQDSLKTVYWQSFTSPDSLRILDFKSKFVVLDFWSNWSDKTPQSHRELAKVKQEFPDSLQVISAAVGLRKDEAQKYMSKHNFPFHLVNGSPHFSDFNIPGLPVELVYVPGGKLQSIFLGYPDNTQYDSLRALITHGQRR